MLERETKNKKVKTYSLCKETMPVLEHIYYNLLPLTLSQGHPNCQGIEIHAPEIMEAKRGHINYCCLSLVRLPQMYYLTLTLDQGHLT